MPKLGATSFESELTRLTGSRNDTSSRLTRWRRDGYWFISHIPDLPEFVRTYDRSVNPGTVSFTLPADLRAIYHIQEIRPTRHKLTLVPRTWIDKRTFTAGDVSDCARQDRTLYLGNSLSVGRAFRFTYQRQPTLPTGTSTHAYDEALEPVHLKQSQYIAIMELHGNERAMTIRAERDMLLMDLGIDPKRLPETTSVQQIETRNIEVTLRPLIR